MTAITTQPARSGAYGIPFGSFDVLEGAYSATLTGATTLDHNYPLVSLLDPGGATRVLTLEAEADAEGRMRCIVNTADAAEDLTVQDDTPATVSTISPGEAAFLYCDGVTWTQLHKFAGAGASATLTVGAEATNVIPVVMAGFAAVTQYVATVYDAAMLQAVTAAFRIAETGAGAEVSTTLKPTLLFTTDATGAATLSVTDVAGASGLSVYLEVRPAATSAGIQGSGSTIVSMTFD